MPRKLTDTQVARLLLCLATERQQALLYSGNSRAVRRMISGR